MNIPCNEILFHPLSFADPSGRLFWWSGDLYRGIGTERASLYRELFDRGVVQTLVEKKLIVDSERSSYQVDGYAMTIKHKTIPFVSYPFEWCAAMLKDAALLVLDLEVELAQSGLTLQDAHPWNVVFDGPTPVHVDFGSIVAALPDVVWCAYDEFYRFFLNPLLIMSQGHGRIARSLLHDYEGISNSDLNAFAGISWSYFSSKRLREYTIMKAKQLVPDAYRPRLKQSISFVKSRLHRIQNHSQSRLVHIQRLRKKVENIPIPTAKTTWSNYYDAFFPSFSPSSDWTSKERSSFQVLSELTPRSVLDIGSNQGWHSQLAAVVGSRVVACDVDETSIANLYFAAKAKKYPILPLILDFRNPSPGYGLCNQWLSPATERLQCEMVFALALIHHLVFKQSLNFDQIVDGLSVFCKKWLVVEFIPREDRYVRDWWSEKYSWYTLDNFVAAVKKKFHDIRVLPSYPEPRVLILGKKT